MRVITCAGTLLVTLSSTTSLAAPDVAVDKKMSERLLERAEICALGLSFGPRFVWGGSATATSASVTQPGQVSVEQKDWLNMVISGAVAATPWRKAEHKYLWRLAFIAKLDLIAFDANSFSGPSRTIEGGIGIGVKVNDYFAVMATFDRVFARSLRTGIDKDNVTDMAGQPVTTIDIADDRYFTDNYLGGGGLSFLFLL